MNKLSLAYAFCVSSGDFSWLSCNDNCHNSHINNYNYCSSCTGYFMVKKTENEKTEKQKARRYLLLLY